MPHPTPPKTIIALTGKQKVALMLERANYSPAQIAQEMGLRHAQSAYQLLARAHAAQKAYTAAVADYLSRN